MHIIEAVVAQELKHLLKHRALPGWPLQQASLAQRVWCANKAQRKIFRGQVASASYLERYELLAHCM